MTTYIDMINRIQDDLTNSAVTVAQIKNAIQSSISDWENTPFFFNQKTATFNTVNAQEYYSTADLADIPNIVSFYSMELTISGYKRPVQPVDFAVIDDQQNGTILGSPFWYAYFTQQIRMYPIPDTAYTVTLSYLTKFAALVADSDTNAWMTSAEEMIRQAAKRRIALDILYDDTMAARCSAMEDEAFDTLAEESRQKLPNKTLRIPAMNTGRTFNIYQGF